MLSAASRVPPSCSIRRKKELEKAEVALQHVRLAGCLLQGKPALTTKGKPFPAHPINPEESAARWCAFCAGYLDGLRFNWKSYSICKACKTKSANERGKRTKEADEKGEDVTFEVKDAMAWAALEGERSVWAINCEKIEFPEASD